MTCNRGGCPDDSPHVHLRHADDVAVVEAMLAVHYQREAAARQRQALRDELEVWWRPRIVAQGGGCG